MCELAVHRGRAGPVPGRLGDCSAYHIRRLPVHVAEAGLMGLPHRRSSTLVSFLDDPASERQVDHGNVVASEATEDDVGISKATQRIRNEVPPSQLAEHSALSPTDFRALAAKGTNKVPTEFLLVEAHAKQSTPPTDHPCSSHCLSLRMAFRPTKVSRGFGQVAAVSVARPELHFVTGRTTLDPAR